MLKTTKANFGIYLLQIIAPVQFRIGIKRFADVEFPKGCYYYAGSAQKNLRQRLERHLRKDKKIHWHIDHLTTHPELTISAVYIFNEKGKEFESTLVDELVRSNFANYSVDGFGNSDTKESRTHLLYSKKKIAYSHLCSLYQDTVRFIPSSNDTF